MVLQRWTKKEIDFLKRYYGKIPNKDLAYLMERGKQSLQHKAARLSLTIKPVRQLKYCIDCSAELSSAASYTERIVRCRSCADKWHSGENHHNWKGGLSHINSLVGTYLYHVWKIPILKRDNFICQKCGTHDHLEVHHLRPFSQIRDDVIKRYPELNKNIFKDKQKLARIIVAEHELEDGITLCYDCHKNYHLLNQGELLGTPNVQDEGNQQPSLSNVLNFVDRKVQRLSAREVQPDNAGTSALPTIPNSGKI